MSAFPFSPHREDPEARKSAPGTPVGNPKAALTLVLALASALVLAGCNNGKEQTFQGWQGARGTVVDDG